MTSVRSAGPPLGFPNCGKCPYVANGPPRVCSKCASATFERIASPSCSVCDQMVDAHGDCPNWLCSDSNRSLQYVRAIAYLSGPLRSRILKYKYEDRWAWSLIFGRLVLGYLEEHDDFDDVDLIVANPTWTPDGKVGHTERVIDVAEREDLVGGWPFDVASTRAIVKTAATERSANSSWSSKVRVANQLEAVLSVPDPARTRGKSILIYDDVCTTGNQLNVVARVLLNQGEATDVRALVLARAPWRQR